MMDKIIPMVHNDEVAVNKIITTIIFHRVEIMAMGNGHDNHNVFQDSHKTTMKIDFIHRDVSQSIGRFDIPLSLVLGQQPTGRFGYRQRRNSTGGMPNNQQQSNRNTRQQRERSNGNGNRSTLKFVGDFDFEKSNAEFDKNAIEDEIKKSLSIKSSKSETSTGDSPKTEQEKEKEKENQPLTSSSATQSEHQHQQQQETHPDGYYDKQKSFFDRISCEATAKEKTYEFECFLFQLINIDVCLLGMLVVIGMKNVESMLKHSV